MISIMSIRCTMVESHTVSLNKSVLEKWSTGACTVEQQIADLKALHEMYSSRFSFPEVDSEIKYSLVSHICTTFNDSKKRNELHLLLLVLVRMLARDKARSDMDCFGPLTSVLIPLAGLLPSQHEFNKQLMLEAEKCLINILFNAHKARAVFETQGLDQLVSRISAIINYMQSSEEYALKEFSYLKHFDNNDLKDFLFFDLKVAFVTSAQVSKIQEKWVGDTDTTSIFVKAVQKAVSNLALSIQQQEQPAAIECQICNEGLKVLFNVYCHAKLQNVDMASQCTQQCMHIVQLTDVEWLFEVKQNAVNLLALTLPTYLADSDTAALIAPKLSNKDLSSGTVDENQVLEGCDMHLVSCFLTLFQQAIDKFGEGREVELLGTFLTVLIHVCVRNKQARRYCRLCVLPPLTASEVEHAPEKGATLRNKLIRLIQQANASNCHQLAAEFLFVLCKRSVNRLIKYCGFGHSAGLLANYGFLGAATNLVKSNSDSEDSETEDYKDVEHKVNPVTGYIPSESREEQLRRAFESMSEEQKEYEAMKLVDAINKLMDEGVMAPATLGPDGRPERVEHITQLVKDVQLKEEEESD